MKTKLRGYRELNFTTETGDNIRGTQIFMTYEANGVIGEMAAKFFLKPELISINDGLMIDGEYNLDFSPNGKIISIQEI